MWCSSRYGVSVHRPFVPRNAHRLVSRLQTARRRGRECARAPFVAPGRLRPRLAARFFLSTSRSARRPRGRRSRRDRRRNLAAQQVLEVTHLVVGLLRNRELVPMALRRQRRHDRRDGRRRRANGGRRAGVAGATPASCRRYSGAHRKPWGRAPAWAACGSSTGRPAWVRGARRSARTPSGCGASLPPERDSWFCGVRTGRRTFTIVRFRNPAAMWSRTTGNRRTARAAATRLYAASGRGAACRSTTCRRIPIPGQGASCGRGGSPDGATSSTVAPCSRDAISFRRSRGARRPTTEQQQQGCFHACPCVARGPAPDFGGPWLPPGRAKRTLLVAEKHLVSPRRPDRIVTRVGADHLRSRPSRHEAVASPRIYFCRRSFFALPTGPHRETDVGRDPKARRRSSSRRAAGRMAAAPPASGTYRAPSTRGTTQ